MLELCKYPDIAYAPGLGHALTLLLSKCHGTTSLPLLHPPLAASDPFHLHSAPSASTSLQLRSIPVQLMQLCHTHSQTNHGSMLDLFGPGSHTKGCCLYTLSTFVLFA